MRSLRIVATAGLVLGALISIATIPARASPVQIDVTVNFASPPTTAPWTLTGTADLFLAIGSAPVASFNIGSLSSPSASFITNYIPGDPCVGGATCTVYFDFSGSTNEAGTAHPTYGFQTGNVPPSDPGNPSELPVGVFIPGDPCFNGTVCHASGPIVAFSDPLQVGTWEVTIQAQTPLPGTLPLLATGLAALGLIGCRRNKKAARPAA